MEKDGRKSHKHIKHTYSNMDKLIKYNLDLFIDNISNKYDIPKSKLNDLAKNIKIPTYNELFEYKLPIYKDRNNTKYAILTHINDEFFYALLIK